MEAAEADLRSLQDTCRQLIVRTAASQQQQQQTQQQQQQQQENLEQQVVQELPQSPAQSTVESDSTDPVCDVNTATKPTKQKRSPPT